MATVVLGVVGGTIGWYTGGPSGARLGWSIGTLLGAGIEGSRTPTQDVGRTQDIRVSGSAYGVGIPIIHGQMRLAGNVVWASALRESSRKTGVRLLGTRRRTFTYHMDLAVAWCRGPVSRIIKILGDEMVIYDSAIADPDQKLTIRNYMGTETQTKDTLISAAEGAANTPAYRGTCYSVFENLPLSNWGNRLPNFNAVVEVNASAFTLEEQPLMYWRFEDYSTTVNTGGKLHDWGSKGYHLTDTGGTSTQVTGAIGEGISTTGGVTLERTIGQDTGLQGAEFSISLRYRFKGVVGDGALQVAYISNAGRFPWKLRVTDNLFTSTTHFVPSIHSLASGGSVFPFTSAGHSVVRDTNWHHLAWTHDAEFDTLYHDGAEVAQAAAVGNPITVDSHASNYLSLEGNGFELDEVAFFSEALDAETIARQSTSDVQVRHVVASVMRDVGLTGEQWDLDEATDPVRGHIISSRTEARSVLSPLLQVHFTDLAEVDGLLKAIKRGGAVAGTISEDDLGCHLWQGAGNEPETLVAVRRTQDLELPLRVDLSYFSSTKDFEQSTEGAIRYTKGNVDNLVSISTPLVLTETEAKRMTEALLYDDWIAREQYTFSLPWSYLHLHPGEVWNLPVGSSTRRVKITQITAGLFGPLQIQAVQDEASVLTQVATGSTVETSTDESVVTDTTLVAWSNNAIVNEDAESVGYYVAAAGNGTGYWPGALLYQSNDNGGSYQEVGPLEAPAIRATTTTVLAAGTTTGAFDDTNTVDITLLNGSIESVSDAELLAGENLFMIGSEYVKVGTVTPLGGSSYRLSHLLRGRRGTDSLWGTHAIGEAVVLLEEGLYTRVDQSFGMRGKTVLLKAVTEGSTLADTSPVSLAITGAEFTAYAPVDIQGSRDGSNNLTITWVRRTRVPEGLQDMFDEPLGETDEEYEVEILAATPDRIITSNVQSATYTAAQQTSDGLTPGDPVTVTVYQIGSYGRGYGRTATI